MAYDEGLAERLREAMGSRKGITERKMFGGIAFLHEGHMFVGIATAALMARVGPAHYEEALAQAHVRVMDFTGKPMRGHVFVDPDAIAADVDLRQWGDRCLDFVGSLPPKSAR